MVSCFNHKLVDEYVWLDYCFYMDCDGL